MNSERYRKAREDLSFTQKELAQELEINIRTVQGRELGDDRYRIRRENALALQGLRFQGPFTVEVGKPEVQMDGSEKILWISFEGAAPCPGLETALQRAFQFQRSQSTGMRWRILGKFGQVALTQT